LIRVVEIADAIAMIVGTWIAAGWKALDAPSRHGGRAFAGVATLLTIASATLAAAEPSSVRAPRGEGAIDKGHARVVAELLVDAASVGPGERVRIGVLFTPDPGWHIYWRNPGDSGAATQLTWRTSGAEIGPMQWPAPRVFREADGLLTTFGYEGDVLLASDAAVAMDARRAWRIEVDADFVACKIDCIPSRIELARDVPVTARGAPPSSAVRSRFDLAASRVPLPAEALGVVVEARPSQSAVRAGDEFRVMLDVASCVDDAEDCTPWTLAATRAEEAFVPEMVAGLDLSPLGLARTPAGSQAGARGFSLVVSGRAWEDPRIDLQRLRGVVPLARAGRTAHLAVDVPLARAPADVEVAFAPTEEFEVVDPLASPAEIADAVESAAAGAGVGSLSLGVALVLALVGGLVLNLMPCVLPVLALKVFAVADLAHAGRGRVVRHGFAYLGGVLVSMATLATAVVALRAAGTSVGWGFQFQEPVFLAAICTLLVVFAMNLFGVFEVTFQPSGPDHAPAVGPHGSQRSFFEGTLAVVLATPCTAPFLGTAVGFAFAGSNAVIFSIFSAIGVGLAAPYVLVTLVPGWARLVPRPGAWMLRVRAALGFSLLAAVVWLLWVAGRALGVDAQGLLLAYLVAIAFLVWILGVLQAASHPVATRAAAVGIAGVVALSLWALPLAPTPRAGPAASVDAIEWLPYDLSAIDRERASGRPVFVDFTADWCITCKVNESLVLANDAVRDELARWNYATFKADWTLRDEEIGRQLAAWGRAGVPMYLVYPADPATEPELLPELLTVEGTIEALRRAGEAGGV
jgi:thiol:disulfide interchange protein DsbD